MRKSIAIPIILVLAAIIATFAGYIGDLITKNFHPVKYSEFVTKYSAQYNVPEPIIYSVIKTESSFRTDAKSHKGAIGLMQITPATFDWLCTKTGEDSNPGLLYDPETNIRYGTYYLSLLYSEFQVWDTVYAAYNAGRGKVNEWLSQDEYNNHGRLKNIPYPETSEYVKKVKKTAQTYERLYYSESETIKESVIQE